MKLKSDKELFVKMILVGVLGIVLIALSIAVFAFGGDNEKKEISKNTEVEQDLSEEFEEAIGGNDEVESGEMIRALALVKKVDYSNGYIQIVDVETLLQVTLSSDSSVVFEDEYGTAIVLEKIQPGMLVNVKYDNGSYKPEFVKVAAQIQTLKNLSSFELDEANKSIQIGSTVYNYNEHIVVLGKDKEIALTEVTVADEVEVKAYQGIIWSIQVINGHGTLILEDYDAFLDGVLEIGNRTSMTIIKEMQVPLAAGEHQLIITKEGLEPYVTNISITEGEETRINLKDYTPQVGKVRITVVQEEVTLYLNGEKIEDYSQELILDYDIYNVKVTKDGFEPWEGKLTVDAADVEFVINMSEKPLYIHLSGTEGGEFYIDGVYQGTIEGDQPISAPITSGGHILTLRKEGYLSWTQSVYIDDQGEDYYYSAEELKPIEQESNNVENNSGNNGNGNTEENPQENPGENPDNTQTNDD
ncbi:MAG: PEGA domain-containing protein [Vallitaleaceae bacterium]|nr:PEGA domain-containing protein [Vallitaleaceae bacterium]